MSEKTIVDFVADGYCEYELGTEFDCPSKGIISLPCYSEGISTVFCAEHALQILHEISAILSKDIK